MAVIKISFRKGFKKSARVLNRKNLVRLTDLIVIFSNNSFHSKLHTKALTGKLAGLFSFRITREWRVIFKFISPEEILIIKVRHRKDIYR